MWIQLIDTLTHLSDVAPTIAAVDVSHGMAWHPLLHSHADLLAQQFDTDVFRGVREAFGNFFESGQVWALLIGFILGYLLRGITTYS